MNTVCTSNIIKFVLPSNIQADRLPTWASISTSEIDDKVKQLGNQIAQSKSRGRRFNLRQEKTKWEFRGKTIRDFKSQVSLRSLLNEEFSRAKFNQLPTNATRDTNNDDECWLKHLFNNSSCPIKVLFVGAVVVTTVVSYETFKYLFSQSTTPSPTTISPTVPIETTVAPAITIAKPTVKAVSKESSLQYLKEFAESVKNGDGRLWSSSVRRDFNRFIDSLKNQIEDGRLLRSIDGTWSSGHNFLGIRGSFDLHPLWI